MQFRDAINVKAVGADDYQNTYMINNLKKVLNTLKNMKRNQIYGKYYYIECLPVPYIRTILNGALFYNKANALCSLNAIHPGKDGRLMAYVNTEDSRYYTRSWKMSLFNLLRDCNGWAGSFALVRDYYAKYLTVITKQNIDGFIANCLRKIAKCNNQYHNIINQANSVINSEINSYENKMVVSRSAIKRAMLSVRKDAQIITDAFNSSLTKEEQEQLIKYLKKNVYSMRLYVVKGTEWDQAITSLYPDEQYGKKRRTEATEKSKNSIGGYISVNSVKDAPLDIIQKITHKADKTQSFIRNKGSNKYRLNNYLLVLFLLNNYNQDGFITGKTNLNKALA